MSLIKKLFLISGLLLFVNCSKDNTGPDDTISTIDDENPDDEPISAIEPAPAILIFPENHTECNEGVAIDDEWSLVNFQWNASTDTDSYEIWIKNSGNLTWESISTDKTEIEIQIARGVQYQWNVVSKNSNSTKKATSETWQFYNSGPGSSNYAPFTPTLIYPRDGQILRSGDSYYFQWTTSDLDNDPILYDLFVGSHPDSLNLMKTLSDTKEFIYTYVNHNEWSYWKIHASDNHGNTSKSDIHSFIRL